ncbi:hypothetical protein BDR06DRAFT_999677 [Suillus hirtellus]|nr:hypothetical protein BDR06DRAFT_999677 [Suillus hirtellus]
MLAYPGMDRVNNIQYRTSPHFKDHGTLPSSIPSNLLEYHYDPEYSRTPFPNTSQSKPLHGSALSQSRLQNICDDLPEEACASVQAATLVHKRVEKSSTLTDTTYSVIRNHFCYFQNLPIVPTDLVYRHFLHTRSKFDNIFNGHILPASKD